MDLDSWFRITCRDKSVCADSLSSHSLLITSELTDVSLLSQEFSECELFSRKRVDEVVNDSVGLNYYAYFFDPRKILCHFVNHEVCSFCALHALTTCTEWASLTINQLWKNHTPRLPILIHRLLVHEISSSPLLLLLLFLRKSSLVLGILFDLFKCRRKAYDASLSPSDSEAGRQWTAWQQNWLWRSVKWTIAEPLVLFITCRLLA